MFKYKRLFNRKFYYFNYFFRFLFGYFIYFKFNLLKTIIFRYRIDFKSIMFGVFLSFLAFVSLFKLFVKIEECVFFCSF